MKTKLTILAMTLGAMSTLSTVSVAEDAFYDALTDGKVSFSARARYESVKQKNALKNADAFTVRTTLGYKTGDFYGFKGFVEVEDVSELGNGHFNDKVHGNPAYSVVADPDGTEVNQAYLQYDNFDTQFRFGRQEITYRKAPFHRFIGTVLWRQNHQSFDAFSVTNTAIADLKFSYAYLNKIHTILGTTQDADSHLINVQYTGLPIGKLEGYGYLLGYGNGSTKDSQTFGARLTGAQAVTEDWKVIYTAEFANQDEYKNSTILNDQNYYLAEIGAKCQGWMAKISYEMQEGNGTDSFKTPLGTNHAFQGWADMFLSTPKEGLQDVYLTVVGHVMGAKLVAVYHDFETDQGSLNAGSEIDLLVQKTFNKHYTLAVKYSDYNADNQFTNGGKLVDTKKFWLFGQVKF